MKTKNLLALFFALVFVFTSAVPAFAEEGELPSVPVLEDEVIQPPEETPPAADPVPEEEPVPEPEPEPEPEPDPVPEPVPGEEPPAVPTDPVEGEEVPPASEIEDTQDPGPEELPGEDGGELPDAPQPPEGGEIPDESGEDPGEVAPEEEDPGEEVPGEQEEPEEDETEPAPEEDSLIDVLVPNSGQVIINPYCMKVSTSSGETTDQIVHEPQALVSYTGQPLEVAAQVLGRLQPESEARFVAGPPAEDGRDKEIFMYVEFQSDPAQWSYTYGDWPNQILVTDWQQGKENVLTLDAYGVGYFRVFGAMTPFPASMWTDADAADLTVAFTFTPAVQPDGFPPLETFPEASPEASSPEAFPEIFPEPLPEPQPELFPEDFPPAGEISDAWMPEEPGEELILFPN